MIGQYLNNRYEVTTRLGKGAMGIVYRAVDTQSGRDVAIKVISSELAVDPAMLERFKREGQALSKLKHPNIVGFIGAFQHGEHYVIVMEYVSSGSLYELLRGSTLPIERTIEIALDLCDALSRAHRLNIIHRDIKPENILIDEDGTPKLADFGVAHLREGTRMTRSGVQVGTPHYMSPEAWEGKMLDEQADIWSLGVVIFEMLTGQVPFGGDTALAVMRKISTTHLPDLKKLRADVPSGLVKIVGKMLTRDKRQRYQTIRELAVDLERLQQAMPHVAIKAIPSDAGKENPRKANRRVIPRLKASFSKSFASIRSTTLTIPTFLRIASFVAIILALFWIGSWAVSNFLSFTPIPKATATQAVLVPIADANTPKLPTQTPKATTTPTKTSTLTPTSLPVEITDLKGIKMVLVSAGEFTMGSDSGDDEEKPFHFVYLNDYYIDKYEVTNAHYKTCVDEGVCDPPRNISSTTHSSYYGNPDYDNYPVIYVDWNQARAYCEWRKGRLPSEAEWEKAARGTDRRTYPWGEGIDCDMANYHGCIGDTTEVGTYQNSASPYGALDMAGNVWEWVNSMLAQYPYKEDWREDINAFSSRVQRGGAWDSFSTDTLTRTTQRTATAPSNALAWAGFRCASTPP